VFFFFIGNFTANLGIYETIENDKKISVVKNDLFTENNKKLTHITRITGVRST